MKIIVALDSFKGSCTATQACAAVKRGMVNFCADAQVIELPIADGGEGLIEALWPSLSAQGYRLQAITVTGPYLQPTTCNLLLKDEHCIIEMAQCSGLTLQAPEKRRAREATTFGLGQAVKYALNLGCRRFSIGLGGSATNDGGAGFVQALGCNFFSADGTPITRPLCGGDLINLGRIDASSLCPKLQECTFIGTCDVSNPLLGANGATAIFGPQKGLVDNDLELLEQGMKNYATLLGDVGREYVDKPGAGAAGGMGFALSWACQAQLKSGIDEVLNLVHIDDMLPGTNLVIVGEGRMDSQSCQGKAPVGVARRAKKFDLPVVALCGALADDARAVYSCGIDAMFSICPRPMPLEQSMADSEHLLQQAAENIVRLFALGRA